MLLSAILGIGLLVAAIFLMRWYVNADPAVLRRVLKWTAIWLLALVAIFLALTGRFAAAFGMVMGIVAFGWRLLNMMAMAQQMRGMFSGLGGGFGGSGQAAAGQSSQVESHFLRMRLDHDTGSMDGDVLIGQFQGRVLSAMSVADLLELCSEVSGDSDSLGLLEAYLDRAHVGWREEAGAEASGARDSSPSRSSGPMTRNEAHLALGLEPGASRREIKAAYRQLMAKVHPDRGGSAYLAAKINEAKDLLLSD
ncbi:MAG: DnaJ domain-containing protein [Rhodospirillaceae bacterium]|jgi:DnaJ-domain-containing protein 1|nr:DnaJ domain-containing protein [Rhodospirillaceae bacterium]